MFLNDFPKNLTLVFLSVSLGPDCLQAPFAGFFFLLLTFKIINEVKVVFVILWTAHLWLLLGQGQAEEHQAHTEVGSHT